MVNEDDQLELGAHVAKTWADVDLEGGDKGRALLPPPSHS